MKPVLVKTTIEVPRVLDIIVAWNANISLMCFCSEWVFEKNNQIEPKLKLDKLIKSGKLMSMEVD